MDVTLGAERVSGRIADAGPPPDRRRGGPYTVQA